MANPRAPGAIFPPELSSASTIHRQERRKAKSFERKKQRPRRILLLEVRSPLKSFFTGGVEYDSRVEPSAIEGFIEDFHCFIEAFCVAPDWGEGVELKFRPLGHHRADGLYYPEQAVLVLDLKSSKSFAHEFGHLVDYGASRRGSEAGGGALSSSRGFLPFRQLLLSQMEGRAKDDPRLRGKKGRLSWRYFTSPAECFARAFEQYVSEVLPSPSSLVGEPARFRADPLFFQEIPPALGEYFSALLAGGHEQAISSPPARTTPGWPRLACP
jgi:hypothetical protein